MDFPAPWGQGYFDPDYVNVSDGFLDLSVEKIGNDYYHGGIKSRNSAQQMQFGYLEVSAKVPIGKGFWPTFWLYNASCNDEWYDEIDILEPYFSSHTQEMNQINWHTYKPICSQVGFGPFTLDLTGENINTSYHKYAVEWLPDHMVFYYDDEPWFSVFNNSSIPTHGIDNLDGVDGLTVYCDLQINNEDNNPPDDTTDLTQTYRVDYIRFYELDETFINTDIIVNSTNKDLASVYKTISFQSGIVLAANDHLTFRATDYITISNDFTAPLGTEMTLYFFNK
jgi:beta-glucanase (GH16 family)